MGSTLFLENVNELVRYFKPNVIFVTDRSEYQHSEIGLVFKYRFGKLN